jgi:hypothetical protein
MNDRRLEKITKLEVLEFVLFMKYDHNEKNEEDDMLRACSKHWEYKKLV